MSFHKEDGVSSLCQKALHIVTELCFAGQVEWEKCSGIFPPDRGSQGGGSTGNRAWAPPAPPRPAAAPRAPLPRASRAAPGPPCGTHAFLPRSFLPLCSWRLRAQAVRVLPPLHPPGSFHFSGLLPARRRRLAPWPPHPSPRSPTPRVSLPEQCGERGRAAPGPLVWGLRLP